MRAPMLVLILACSPVWAGDEVQSPRFEVRSARVHTEPHDQDKRSNGRFALAAHVATIDAEPDADARFQAKTTLKAASASCGPQDGPIFSDGFEGT